MAANFETKKTTKDKDSIWVEKYQYYFKKPTNKDGSKRYVCSEEGCSASVTIINGDVCKVNGIFIREYNSETIKQAHKDNHEPISDQKIFEIDFKLTMKDAIEQQPDNPVGQVYNEQQNAMIHKLGSVEAVADSLPQLIEIESGLIKHKKKKFVPVIPASIENINIVDEWKLCVDGKRFLAYHQKLSNDDDRPAMIIFVSDIGIKILSKSKRWHADGTFKVVPKPKGFYQLYIIHAYYKHVLLPCVYALLTGKDTRDYKYLILQLKEAALNFGAELQPKYIMVDFESAVMNAFKYHFPTITIRTCMFHLAQSFYRKLVECGFKTQYVDNKHLNTWFKKVIALSLIPPSKVADIFVELLEEMHDKFDLQGEFKYLENFVDYVLLNYIGDDATPTFPIELWNHFDANERTNNDVEAYNYRLNTVIGPHKNIWTFIKKIKTEESATQIKFLRIENETFRKRERNSKDIKRDLKISECKVSYFSNKITLNEY
jgi:hypothetical protein